MISKSRTRGNMMAAATKNVPAEAPAKKVAKKSSVARSLNADLADLETMLKGPSPVYYDALAIILTL